jgi:flagellar hook assembly protein FlgD
MKKLLFFCLLFFTNFTNSYSQNGTEWIVPNQKYFKVKTWQDGIYKLPISLITQSGISISDTNKLQCWFRGKETAISVINDTILFYGKRNDGTLDSLLYSKSKQPHPYYNIHSDTCVFFFTLGQLNGKRISDFSNNNSTNLVKYCINKLDVYSDLYYRGKVYSLETFLTDYDQGEGWFSPTLIKNSNQNFVTRSYSISLNNPIEDSDSCFFEIQLVGVMKNLNRADVLIGNSSSPDYILEMGDFNEFEHSTKFIKIPSSYLVGKSSFNFTIKSYGNPGGISRIALAYTKLIYTSNASVNNLFINNKSNANGYISYASKLTSSNIVWDISNIYDIINCIYKTNALNTDIPILESTKELIISKNHLFISKGEVVNINIPNNYSNYIIIYPTAFYKSSRDYLAYRKSIAGGGFDTSSVCIEKLYDLFSYGEFSPIAIKRFCDFLNLTNVNKYILILGKGVTMNTRYFDKSFIYYRKNPSAYWNNKVNEQRFVNLIPTYGVPGSDLMYSLDVNYFPKIPIGRVSARSDQEVYNYLNKVKDHESLDSNLIWRKNGMHLSGGRNASEIALFKSYVDNFKSYYEMDYFDGKIVKTLTKNLENGAVDDQLQLSIADIVNQGVSHLTFFGHASNQTIDVDIGFVSNPLYGYNNKGKYPMFLVNGCLSSDIYNYYSFAEDWIVTADKGAINIIGHSDNGYAYSLYDYSKRFYAIQFLNKSYINESIGKVQQKIIDSLIKENPNDAVNQSIITQMVLSGDPAIKTYPTSKSDYAIYSNTNDQNNVIVQAYNNSVITSKDSFKIILPIYNYGIGNSKTVDVLIKRSINNVLVKNYELKLNPVKYLDSLVFYINNDFEDYTGLNVFDIYVDSEDSLIEMRETNNYVQLSYFMPSSSVKCIYPLNYSIVNQLPLTLVAQPSNLLNITERDFYFELDTVKTFNSPFKQSNIVTGNYLIKWSIQNINDVYPSDSIVYYWRVKYNDIQNPTDTIWDQFSFVYIKNSNLGWSQSSVGQINEDGFNGIKFNQQSNNYEFINTTISLTANAIGSISASTEQLSSIKINNYPLLTNNFYNNCGGPGGLLVLTIDKSSLQPIIKNNTSNNWKYCGQNYDSRALGFFPYPDLSYTNSPSASWVGTDGLSLVDYLKQVTLGDYIFIMSNGNSKIQTTIPALKTYLKDSLHFTQLDNLKNGDPFMLLVKKGSNSAIYENFINANNISGASLSYSTNLNGSFDNGFILSNFIGPVSEWEKMYLKIDSLPNENNKVGLLRYSVNKQFIDTVWVNIKDSIDLKSELLMDNSKHIYAKLIFESYNNITLTPSQLKHWIITYKGVPEGVNNPFILSNNNFVIPTKLEGDSISLSFAFENISDYDFSNPISLIIEIANEKGKTLLDTVSLSTLSKGKNLITNYKFSTLGFEGKNRITGYFNPYLLPESYYWNNSISTTFEIEKDRTQPFMNVVFDGVKIFDGDIVSANPIIQISLQDNNKFLLLNDPNSVEIFLTYPGATVPIQITSQHPFVSSWKLDNAKTNTFIAEIKPDQLPDGVYTLTFSGKDESGNKTNTQKYSIKFTVVNKPTVTNFYPYPNPFSTNTKFVFTLTGSKVPDDLKIQIMTVSGKVVREITKSELGPINIGNNVSQYSWDGTDEYGDKLANGVYLYRVIIKDSSINYEHASTAGDQAFHKGFGKIYILR